MKKFRKNVILFLVLALLLHIWCSAQFHKEDWEVVSPRLPEAFDGFRVALLTDIHGGHFGNGGEMLLQAVRASEPDIIAISGDLVDRHTEAPERLRPMLEGLCGIAPTYYVTGNHEWDRDDTEQILTMVADCGVTVLRGSWLPLEQGGQTIVLAGVEDPNGYEDQVTPEALMDSIRRAMPDDPYVLMLSHRNDQLPMWEPLQPDVVLSGHGHGGVIRLPLIGGLLSVDRTLFPDDCEGLYTAGRTVLAVSRGLGGIRLWNRPHLPTIVLKSVNNS